ncbi:uncharacterized protein [Rutidosis leptorrhynchoides]|uniref:uncharacterized protein n=1 Tax=Rutidosis leptorrhynchoides TaxID=125765 RepID=UPI003A99B5F1
MNRVLVVKRHGKTSYELLFKRKPNIKHLEPFGSLCTIMVQDTGGKFNSKAVTGRFLGYGNACKRVYNLDSRCVEERNEIDVQRHASIPAGKGFTRKFDYDELFESFHLPVDNSEDEELAAQMIESVPQPEEATFQSAGEDEYIDDVFDDVMNDVLIQPTDQEPIQHTTEESTETDEPRRSSQMVSLPKCFDNFVVNPAGVSGAQLGGPSTSNERATPSANVVTALYTQLNQTGRIFRNAHCCFVSQIELEDVKDAFQYDEWVSIMQEELQQFNHLGVWHLVIPPSGCKPYGLKWVLKNKKDDQGFKVYQMDVKSAFLYGNIQKTIYVTQPPGFVDPYRPEKVYLLEKALYGLHQAPRAWYVTLSNYMIENSSRRGVIDQTLFIKERGEDIMLVQVYVDDIIFGSTDQKMVDEFEDVMQKRFKMSSLGAINFFLGLQVDQTEKGIFLHQSKYVGDILSRFKMENE